MIRDLPSFIACQKSYRCVRLVSQLPAHHSGISGIPVVVTNDTPYSIHADLNPSFRFSGIQRSTCEPDTPSSAACTIIRQSELCIYTHQELSIVHNHNIILPSLNTNQ